MSRALIRLLRAAAVSALYAALSAALERLSAWPSEIPEGRDALIAGVIVGVLLAIDKWARSLPRT